MIPITTFSGKTVAVFGLGMSGIASAKALLAGGAQVAAWDDGEAGRKAAMAAGIALVDLKTADWSKFAALVLAPGVPLTHPEPHWTVKKAQAAGVEVIGDTELFFRERAKVCPEAKVIGITGTNGKSTTTALIAHILREAGQDVQMGGNIGRAVLDLEPFTDDRFYVIEFSSFQIDLTPSIAPTVGVLLNITPDHLDRHGPADDPDLAMRNYAAIKERLLFHAFHAVVNTSDPRCVSIANTIEGLGNSHTFIASLAAPSATRAGVFALGRKIYERSNGASAAVAEFTDVSSLRGVHNGENAAAAYAALSALRIPAAIIASGLTTFPGLPHRMEEIGQLGRVLFINDSKATNADSTEKALASFPRDVFWIVGGKAKEGGIEPLRAYFPGIVRAYLIGASSDDFSRTLDGEVAIIPCGTLEVAVARAAADAEAYGEGKPLASYNVQGQEGRGVDVPAAGAVPANSAAKNPVVLLSPACASYDQFKSFEHRGDAFRALVAALPGVTIRPRAGA